MSKDTGGSAFPVAQTMSPYGDVQVYAEAGMTLRDYAIIKFMAAQIVYEGMEGCDKELMVGCANELAYAMLKARK